jgi:hypothetical protein
MRGKAETTGLAAEATARIVEALALAWALSEVVRSWW